jgi:hypothetical protein
MIPRRALLASLAALGATADRGAMPPVIEYIPNPDDLDAALIALATEKWSHLFAKDERDQDDAAEDAYEDLLGDPSADLDRMSKRAGQHSGRPLGVTGIDALASVGLGKFTGAIVGALVDDDDGYVGPMYGSIVAEEYWKKMEKAAEKREEVFKANKEMYERLEKKLAGQVWDAGWKEGSPPSRNPSRLPNYYYLPPSNPTAAPSLRPGSANWIAPAATAAASAALYAAAARSNARASAWGGKAEGRSRKKKSRKKKMCKKKSRKKKGARCIR